MRWQPVCSRFLTLRPDRRSKPVGVTELPMVNNISSRKPDVCFTSFRRRVSEDWLDANQHMNVSMYDQVFDLAELRFFEEFGISENSIVATRFTAFRLEKFISYENETMLGDKIEIHSRIIWTDFTRIHHFHEIQNLTRNRRSAFADAISIYVDLRSRKSLEMPPSHGRAQLQRYFELSRASCSPDGVLARKNGRRS